MIIANRTLMGFIDLTLILLGSVAMIGQAQLRDTHMTEATKPERIEDRAGGITVPIARLFEPNEARLSPSGRQWIGAMAIEAQDRRLLVEVQPEAQDDRGRLDAWERAAARTGAIMHAFADAGHPDGTIEANMPQKHDRMPGVTIWIGRTNEAK